MPRSNRAIPVELTGLADGEHAFRVRATDPAGNTDESPEVRRWTVDALGPVVSIEDVPVGFVASASAIVAFGSEPGTSFECGLDEAAFMPCSSPIEYAGLPDGERVVSVRATDAAGNTGAPVDAAWIVDTITPVVGFNTGPERPTTSAHHAEFGFDASEPGATLECRLDGAEFAPCVSPVEVGDLADGEHVFDVRATDGAGNQGAVEGWTWTISVYRMM